MTHMAEGERLQADIMLISSSQDNRKKASLFGDLSDTLLMQWQQAVYPAMKMLSYTFGMLWLETVVHPCVESVRSLVLLFGRLVELLLGRRHPKTSEALRKTYGLSPQSATTMRKRQQEEGDENWGAILQQACETSLEEDPESGGKSGSPAVALLPDKKSNGDKAAQQSQAPAAHEEIRGLDDIFPTPVEGIFSEEKKLTGRRGRFHSRKKVGGTTPTPALPEKADTQKSKAPATLSASVVVEEPIRFDESIRQKVRWPERKALPARAAGLETDMDLSRIAALAKRHVALPAAEALVSAPVLSSPLADGRTVASSPLSTSSSSTPSEHTPVSTTVPISGDLSQPRPSTSPVQMERANNNSGLPAKKETARADKPPVRQTAIAKTPPRPVALRPSPRFPDPSSVLADEEGRTFDYILHSNKMLANSITHLVDRYFQKVEQEGQQPPKSPEQAGSTSD